MRFHPLELAIFPSLPTSEPDEPRSRAGRRRLLGPLGFSVLLHSLALAAAVYAVAGERELEAPRSRVMDVGAFVEMTEAAESDPTEELSLEDEVTPLLPTEVLHPAEVSEPSEESDDALPELPQEVELARQPSEVIEVPLHAARRPQPEQPAAPARVVQVQPKPAPPRRRVASRASASPAKGASLKVRSRPNVLSYYPMEARRRGIEGKAIVLIVVDRRGIVIDAKVVESSGSPLLDRQAVRYLYDMRFQPGAGGRTKAPVHFRLR